MLIANILFIDEMKITLSRLGTKNLASLAQRVVNSSKSGKYKIAEEHDFLKALERESAEYDKLYVKLTYSGKGEEITAADMARDKAFYALKLYLKGYKDVPSLPDVTEAAVLYKLMDQYGGNIIKMTYADESAQLKRLIVELDKPENIARLTTLKLKPAYEELKAKQKAFEDFYAEQAEANAELRALPSASSVRARLESALRAYLDLVFAMRSITGWDMLYRDLNEMVKSAAATYRNDRSDKAPDDPNAPKEPKEPKKPRKPKDNDPDIRLPEDGKPKQPEAGGSGTPEKPKQPEAGGGSTPEKPKQPEAGGGGTPEIHLPQE